MSENLENKVKKNNGGIIILSILLVLVVLLFVGYVLVDQGIIKVNLGNVSVGEKMNLVKKKN